MATASAAGAWQGGARPERPYPARAPRPSGGVERSVRPSRPSGPVPGRPGDRPRVSQRENVRDRYEQAAPPVRGNGRPRPADRTADRAVERPASARTMSPARPDSRLRGIVAAAGIFLLTLAGCAVDSFVGMGLGMITLIALAGSTAAAALLVRRRDLLTVIVAPPLVFALVAAANTALAPSASLNLPTMATLLVRGFPTMAAATGVAIVLTVFRLLTRR